MSIILCEGFPAGCMLILTQAQSLAVKSDMLKFQIFSI